MGDKIEMMKTNLILRPTLFLLALTLLWSCSKDDDDTANTPGEYQTQVYLTDAPIDNANVQGVFVTVADVKVNGESLKGFQKATVEISSLTNGTTKLLGNVDLEAGTTSSIVLVLDNSTAADGSSPGSFVLTTEGQKKALTTSSNEINVGDNAEILATNENKLILDFDLRKSLIMNSSGEFAFAGSSQLSNSIRAVNAAKTGTVAGTFTNMQNSSADAVVVFAYEAGTYSESEMESTSNGVQFANAVSSSLVNKSNGNFALHFLEEGDYELHFVAFSDDNGDGTLEAEGEMKVSTASELQLSNISVDANSTTTLELTLEGLLGL